MTLGWGATCRSWKRIALLPVCVARLASAEPPPVRARGIHLEVARTRGALNCPDQATLSKGIVALLGYDPFGVPVERVIVASLAGNRDGYSATVSLQASDGRPLGRQELSYEIASCDELASAIELAIALAIDPLALAPQSAKPSVSAQGGPGAGDGGPDAKALAGVAVPGGTPGPVATHSQPRPEEPPVEDRSAASAEMQPEATRFDCRLSVAAAAAFGAAPTTVPALAVGVELHLSRASIGLEVRGDFAGHEAVPGGSISTSLLVAELVPCYHFGVLGACGLIGAGTQRSTGVGLEPSHSSSDPYLALGARVCVDLAITSWLWVRPEVDLWFPTTSITLTVADHQEWTSSAFSPVVGIALVVALTKPRATP
jgi:hypothetical protein